MAIFANITSTEFLSRGSSLGQPRSWGRRGSVAWALRIRSLHGFPLSPLASAATPCIVATAAALCAASMARIVANSRRRADTCSKEGEGEL